MKGWHFTIFFSLMIASAWAQQPTAPVASVIDKKIDSLQLMLPKAKNDTAKANILLKISNEYLTINDFPNALKFAGMAMPFTQKKADEKSKAAVYYVFATVNQVKALYELSLAYADTAKQLFEVNGNELDLAKTYRLIGMDYTFLENYPEAIKYLYQSLKIYEEKKNEEGLAYLQENLSGCYSDLGRTEEALGLSIKAFAYWKKKGEKYKVAQICNDIGNEYVELGDYNRALKYHDTALHITRELVDKGPVWGLAYTYGSLAKALEKKGNFERTNNTHLADSSYKAALEYYLLTLREWQKIDKNESFGMSAAAIGGIYINIATLNYKTGKIATAKTYLNKGMQISIREKSKSSVMEGYLLMSVIDSLEGNYLEAYIHFKLYKNYQDSILNSENFKNIELYKNRYLFDKKEKELQLLATENKLNNAIAEKQRQGKIFAYGIIATVLLLGGFGFYRYRRYSRLRSEQKILRERLLISQDLHDNIGSTLSSISVYSQVAQIKSDENKKEELNEVLKKISITSGDMMAEMNDTVWAINPHNDSMEKIIQRMESFAKPLLATQNISLRLNCEPAVLTTHLDMDKRKNFYLIFKEAINNAFKYAGCSELIAEITTNNRQLILTLKDNGVGFDMKREMVENKLTLSGNGLRNMRMRAEEMNGELHLSSSPGKGTEIQLRIPIP